MTIEALQRRLDEIGCWLLTITEAAQMLQVSQASLPALIVKNQLTLLGLRDLVFLDVTEIRLRQKAIIDQVVNGNLLSTNIPMPELPAPNYSRLRRYLSRSQHPLQRELHELSYDLLSFNETLTYLHVQPQELHALIQKGCFWDLHFKNEILLAYGEVENYRLRTAILRGETMEINFFPNRFRGLNPLLHHIYQTPNMAVHHKAFHTAHLTDISHALNKQLIPRGYRSLPEEQLKIGRTTYFPDIQIIKKGPVRPLAGFPVPSPATLALTPAQPTLVRLPRNFERQLSVVISYLDPETQEPMPVTVIELLSPSNLNNEVGLNAYLEKRALILENGLNLVELHYLNTYPPFLEKIPLYPEEVEAKPYHIAVTRPRTDMFPPYPSDVYLFAIDEPIPNIAIPLLGEEQVIFSFDQAYQHTFEQQGLGQDVNYDQIPESITQTFTPEDQYKIKEIAQMAREEYLRLYPNLQDPSSRKPTSPDMDI
jgi:hypothetical protein